MPLITDLNKIPKPDRPSALTIGTFDGVHLGHQALLQHLRDKLPPGGILTVLTFSNHPSHLFTPDSPTPLIYPPLHKAKHLFESGVDCVILVPFTKEFAQTPYDDFLEKLKTSLSFSYLAFGAGAVFGKNREGNETKIRHLAPRLNFEVDYLPKFLLDGSPVSSGRIRTLISQADFSAVKSCLGRPYSLMGRLSEDLMHFPGICLPPEGAYPVHLKTTHGTYPGKTHVFPKKEQIHIDAKISLTDQDIEVIF
jgi:riboflavin kinase/FMN adenylyltransferase